MAEAFKVEKSLSGRAWRLRDIDSGLVADISRKAGTSEIVARMLAARGVLADEAEAFLNPTLRHYFPDPSAFMDMDIAVAAIWDALEAGRNIAVFADYDVDGATSASQLIRYFRHLGQSVLLYVPDRIEEGYGPSAEAFEKLKEMGAELVITVDCGAAAHEPLEAAKTMGLDVVVIDHHLMSSDLPPALAIVNPNRPGDTSGCGHMAAAGVTFVLLAALNREGRRRNKFDKVGEPDLIGLADLSALGTLCDVVALRDINRAIVSQGLKVMGRWSHAGMKALAEVGGLTGEPSAYHLGFVLGPRINAGGRVGKADLGARLLSSDDPGECAEIAAELDRLNAERKQIEMDVLEEAQAQLEAADTDSPVLVAHGEGWHPGVIGIVAGRLKERFGRPCIVIGTDNGIGKGSGRSVSGVDLGSAVAAARTAGLLQAGGGHPMAAGLTVSEDRIAELTDCLRDQLQSQWAASHEDRALKLDAVLTPAGASVELADSLMAAAPYGQGFSEPRFVLRNVRVAYAERVGADHVRFSLTDESGQRVNGIIFRQADQPIGAALLGGSESLWHAAGRLKVDEWRGNRRVQFHLEDLAAAT
ncbi:single-stranded-DNA-specific exonuclease RecJ [Hyphobacterium sp. HN65]|uniref:Single-stranded-DNA-specific exonuclease RecJ n=1 Tax=Hyphobacterium lacteum TaxID=3116575 RepID=A0ABU7LM96_9PROT|nr:single-stranded-DNA-specific exonuclease RecJ [Hyphobacterium sp. HN65]MEE2524998.1 single-stranded-DNA-specific exonuclease RecJ [Hyphobacterium sp. HN65]